MDRLFAFPIWAVWWTITYSVSQGLPYQTMIDSELGPAHQCDRPSVGADAIRDLTLELSQIPIRSVSFILLAKQQILLYT